MPKAAYAIFKEDQNGLTLAKVIADNLDALSSNPQDTRSLWGMLEGPAEFRFDWFQSGMDWTDWTAGRIFGTKGELRFWRRGDLIHVVVLTDDDKAPLPHMEQSYDLKDYSCSKLSECYLWGNLDGKAHVFVETRLPRDLKYPVLQPMTRARLKVKTYTHKGVPEFVRFCEVIPESHGE